MDEKSNEENKSGNHVQESMDGIPKKDSRYNSIRHKGRKTNHKAKVIIGKNEWYRFSDIFLRKRTILGARKKNCFNLVVYYQYLTFCYCFSQLSGN